MPRWVICVTSLALVRQGNIYSVTLFRHCLLPALASIYIMIPTLSQVQWSKKLAPVIYPQNGPNCCNNRRRSLLHRRHTHRMSLTHFQSPPPLSQQRHCSMWLWLDCFLPIYLSCHAKEMGHPNQPVSVLLRGDAHLPAAHIHMSYFVFNLISHAINLQSTKRQTSGVRNTIVLLYKHLVT